MTKQSKTQSKEQPQAKPKVDFDAPVGSEIPLSPAMFSNFALDDVEKEVFKDEEKFSEWGIPIPDEMTEADFNAAHADGRELKIPVHVARAFEAAGWKLKWARYRFAGEYDHNNMNKYLLRLKARFVTLGMLERVDPLYAASMELDKYKGTAPSAKGEQILTKGNELALVMYPKVLADHRQQEMDRRSKQAMGEQLKKVKSEGLTVEHYSSQIEDSGSSRPSLI